MEALLWPSEGVLGSLTDSSQITVGIGNEVRDGNLELSGMVCLRSNAVRNERQMPADNQNDTFASTTNFLGGTFRRMTKMATRQGGHWCWFMGFLVFVLWIFVVLWWFRR